MASQADPGTIASAPQSVTKIPVANSSPEPAGEGLTSDSSVSWEQIESLQPRGRVRRNPGIGEAGEGQIANQRQERAGPCLNMVPNADQGFLRLSLPQTCRKTGSGPSVVLGIGLLVSKRVVSAV
jgi:hypothetical protein